MSDALPESRVLQNGQTNCLKNGTAGGKAIGRHGEAIDVTIFTSSFFVRSRSNKAAKWASSIIEHSRSRFVLLAGVRYELSTLIGFKCHLRLVMCRSAAAYEHRVSCLWNEIIIISLAMLTQARHFLYTKSRKEPRGSHFCFCTSLRWISTQRSLTTVIQPHMQVIVEI